VHAACSLVKVPILALLLKDAEEGGTRLEEKISIPPEKRVGGTGLICHLEPEAELSWRDVMKLMVIVSDNSATNAVIDLLGIERIDAFFKSIGLTSTELQRKMMDMEAIKAGRNNYTTAADMGRLLKLAATGSLVNRTISDAVIDTMSRQLYTSKLPALLPGVPASASPEEKRSPLPGTVTVANKTGDLPKTEHDVGLFILPRKEVRRRDADVAACLGERRDRLHSESLESGIRRALAIESRRFKKLLRRSDRGFRPNEDLSASSGAKDPARPKTYSGR